MFFLVRWSDQSTSVIEDGWLRHYKNGRYMATHNGSQYHPVTVLFEHNSKKYLQNIYVGTDGLYSAKRNKLIRRLSVEFLPSPKYDVLPDVLQSPTDSHGGDSSYERPVFTGITAVRNSPNIHDDRESNKNSCTVHNNISHTASPSRTHYYPSADESIVSHRKNHANTIVPEWKIWMPSKMELVPNSGVFVRTIKLEQYLKAYKNRSNLLALSLMRFIVGEENLKHMSPTGRDKYKRIPKDVYTAIEDYVAQNAQPQLTSIQFQDKMKFLCQKIRKGEEEME